MNVYVVVTVVKTINKDTTMGNHITMIVILSTVFLVGYSTACVEWKIKSPPIIFGETAELTCALEINRTHETRTWQGGKGYKVLTYQGAPSNDKKYKEIIRSQGNRLESLLQILRFDENDVNWDYSCSIADHENRKKLKLNPKDFEMHPTTTTSTVVPVFRKNHLDVLVELRKVYPKPECKIMFNEVEITKRLSTKLDLNGIFYTLKEKLHHEFGSRICSGRLTITCLVGKSIIKLHEENIDKCTQKQTPTYNGPKDNFIGVAVLGCVFALFFVIALAYIVRYGKLRKVLCCLVSWRGDKILDQSSMPMNVNHIKDLIYHENQQEPKI